MNLKIAFIIYNIVIKWYTFKYASEVEAILISVFSLLIYFLIQHKILNF